MAVTDQQRNIGALLFFVIAAIALVWVAILGYGRDRTPGPAFDGGGSDSRQQQTCPEELRVIAERRGDGFVRGVDVEYIESMDWDGDGISCE